MKKLFIILLVFTINQKVNAQQMEKPEYLTPFDSGISIKKVVTDDKSTTLYFTAECDSADRMHIPSAFKLSDEEGRLYSVTGCEGIILDSTYVFNEKKNVNFCLSFQPLPATCKVFDCTDACNRYGFPAFYAIHDSGTNLSECEFGKATEDATQRNTRQEKVLHKAYKTGIAKLSVSISPADKLPTASRIEVILPHHWGKSYDFNEKYAKCIGKLQHDGSFKADILIDGPQWCFVIVNWFHYIPVMLLPGEKQHIDIEAIGTGQQKVRYDELSGLFINLYKGQPFLPIHRLPGDADEDYYSRADEEYDNMHTLCNYISAKHHFTELEKRLLSAYFDMFMTYKYLYSVIPKLLKGDVLPACKFLGKIPADDTCIFSVPSFTAVMLRLYENYDKVFHDSGSRQNFLRQCCELAGIGNIANQGGNNASISTEATKKMIESHRRQILNKFLKKLAKRAMNQIR